MAPTTPLTTIVRKDTTAEVTVETAETRWLKSSNQLLSILLLTDDVYSQETNDICLFKSLQCPFLQEQQHLTCSSSFFFASLSCLSSSSLRLSFQYSTDIFAHAAVCTIIPTPVSGRTSKMKMIIVPTNCFWVTTNGRKSEMCSCIMMCCVTAKVLAFGDLGVEFRLCHELEDDGREGVSIECQAIVWLNRMAGVVVQVRMFACSCLPPQRQLHRRYPSRYERRAW